VKLDEADYPVKLDEDEYPVKLDEADDPVKLFCSFFTLLLQLKIYI